MKINKHIEIVRSSTPRLSSMGLKSSIMLKHALSAVYARVGISFVNNEEDLERLIQQKPDLVFLGFKNMPADQLGLSEDEIWIAKRLEVRGINFTGSTVSAMLLDNNKVVAKRVMHAAGILTAPFFIARPGQFLSQDDLPLEFPLFIKPPSEGGGKGIDDNSVVRNFASFEAKVEAINEEFGTPSLVEKYLAGREFSVALLESSSSLSTLVMPVELVSKPNKLGDQLLSQKVKSEDSEHVIAVENGELRNSLMAMATDIFREIGARDYGRIDIRMDEAGKLYFLEANLIPGIAKHDFTSYFTSACWINKAIDYKTMVLSIVGVGLSRNLSHSIDLASEESINLGVAMDEGIAIEPA